MPFGIISLGVFNSDPHIHSISVKYEGVADKKPADTRPGRSILRKIYFLHKENRLRYFNFKWSGKDIGQKNCTERCVVLVLP